jgi:hypothetical protein
VLVGGRIGTSRGYPGAEQFDAGATIHGPFERLQSIDLAFRLSTTPRLQHGVSNRVDIVSYRHGEPLHGMDAASSSIGQPNVQCHPEPPLNRPRNRIASWRIVVNSADAAFNASTLAICRGVIWPRGLKQSAAAVSGEILRPVIGSRAHIAISWSDGGRAGAASIGCAAFRHGARKRARWLYEPV